MNPIQPVVLQIYFFFFPFLALEDEASCCWSACSLAFCRRRWFGTSLATSAMSFFPARASREGQRETRDGPALGLGGGGRRTATVVSSRGITHASLCQDFWAFRPRS